MAYRDREAFLTYQREYNKRNKPQRRAVQRNCKLIAQYGITSAQYDEMLEAQGGVCAICRTDTPGAKKKFFHVDHCHDTGEVRGLLCMSCNSRILPAAEWYLKNRAAVDAYMKAHNIG